ncbi:MAG: hypothetical protein ACKVZH_11010 [Blastocatellia bacterium]
MISSGMVGLLDTATDIGGYTFSQLFLSLGGAGIVWARAVSGKIGERG